MAAISPLLGGAALIWLSGFADENILDTNNNMLHFCLCTVLLFGGIALILYGLYGLAGLAGVTLF